MSNEIRESFRYRYVIANFVYTTLAVRYRRSFLGYIWTVLAPVIKYLIIGYVFQTLGRFDMPNYYGFMFLGSIYYGFVSAVLIGAYNVFLSNEHFIKKIYVPKLVFVLNHVFYEFINFGLVFLGIVVLLLVIGEISLSFYWTFVCISLGITIVMLVGLSIIMAIASVYFRDLQHILEIFLQALFFATPIMYPIDFLSKDEAFRTMMTFNPLFYATDLFRVPILENRLPSMESIWVCVGMAVCFICVGFLMLKRFNNRIVFKL